MEALLLGDDSDDDSDVEEVPKPPAPAVAVAAPLAAPPAAPPASAPAPVAHPPTAAAPAPITTAPPAAPPTTPTTAAASTPAPPAPNATAPKAAPAPNIPLAGPAAGSPAKISNSVLTNRLKSLYNSPPIGAPSKAKGPAAPVAAGKPGGPPTQPPPQQQQAPPPPQRGGGYPPGPAAPSNRSSYGAPPPGSGYPPGAAPSPHMPQPQLQPQPQQPAPATTAGGTPAPRAMPQPKPIGGGVSVGRVPAPLPKARTTQRSAPPSARVAVVPGRGGMHPSSMAGGAPSQPTPQQQHPPQPHQQLQPPAHGQPPLGADSYEPTPLSTIVGRSGSTASSSSGYSQPPNAAMHVNQYPPPPGQRVGHPQQQPARPGAGHPPQPLQPNNPARPAMSGGSVNAGPGHPHNSHGLHGVHKGVSYGGGTSSAGASSAGTSSAGTSMQSASQTELEKKRKEQFLMFTRVLMKYLEQRDKEMHMKAKAQIKECYEKNKAGDPNFASLTISMKSTLRAVVGEVYWKKAEDYLQHFLQSKKGQQREKEIMKRQQQQQQLPPTHPQQQPQQPQQQPQQHPQHPQQQLPQQQPSQQQQPQQPPQQPPKQHVQQAQYMASGVVHQQPGGPTVVGRPTTSSQSGVMAPPPTGRSSVPPPLQQSVSSGIRLTQAQAAAAKKMPLSSIPKSGAPAVASTPPPNPLAPVAPPPVLTAEEAKKQKEEEAKKKKEAQRLKRNADSKARRDRKKKEKEEERKKTAREKKLGGAVHAAAAASVSAPVQPSIAGPGVAASAIVAGQYAPATSTIGIAAAGSAGTSSSAVSAGTRVTATSTAPSTTPTTTSETKKKKVKKKKKKVFKAKSSVLSGTKKKSPTTSEYHELMEMVDHAVMIDVKSLPTLLLKDHKPNINLEEEQRLLLYGDDEQSEKVREIALAAADALESNALDNAITEGMDEGEDVSPLPWKLPAYYTGWGQRNVVSIRTAWAKVRLPEREMQMAEKEQREAEKSLRERPMLVSSTENVEGTTKDGPEGLKSSKAEEVDPVDADATNHVWYNESRAEQDPALAMISEATELYLKAIIEKAIGKARLRQNLDGVRLWHTLCSYQTDPISHKGKPPPALIRLGCDVRRQVALAQGNAAKTYQRMEEAISRRNDSYHSRTPTDPNEMVLEATSMSDLSKMPPLKSAVQDADLEAKRKFEIFGGKDSQEPPLGRVPKKAKVLIQDISIGALGKHAPLMKPPARRRVMPGMFRR